MQPAASLCEVDRAGIEPATPGFSVGLSSPSNLSTTASGLIGCDSGINGRKTRAQQKAQHETPKGAFDPRLAWLIEVWAILPDDVTDAIARLVGYDVDDLNDLTATPAGERGS